jgi:L-alanine-DL-glutamate epimerase-like enolase superfamily enzyme
MTELKLASFSLHPIHISYHRPVTWASSEEDSADFVLLKLTSECGHIGVAEATAKPTWAGVTPRVLIAALEDVLLPRLASVDLADEAAIDKAIGRIPDNGTAKALIYSACWDLRASSSGQPLWSLWGGSSSVEMSWTVSRQTPADMAAEAAAFVGRYGFQTLKVKGGQTPEIDYAALAEIRSAVGDDVAIYVDANSAYSMGQARDYCTSLADRGMIMVEDPYRLQPNDDFRQFQAACPIPILVDSGCRSPKDATDFFAHGAQAVGIKPGRIGLSAARRCVEITAENDGRPIIGLFGESDLGMLSSCMVASTIPRSAAEPSFCLMMQDGLLQEAPAISGGVLTLPETAGLAELIDWQAVERLRID